MTSGRRRADGRTSVDRILAAARRVFIIDGTAPLSRVAAEAGVAEATLYRHFPNRQALAAKVYENVFLTEIKPAVLALSNDAPRESFIEALARLEDVMIEQRALLASLDDLAGITAELIVGDRIMFEDIITQAQATGVVRADLTANDVATFVAMVTTASVAMDQPAALRRRYLHLLVDAISGGEAPPLPDTVRDCAGIGRPSKRRSR